MPALTVLTQIPGAGSWSEAAVWLWFVRESAIQVFLALRNFGDIWLWQRPFSLGSGQAATWGLHGVLIPSFSYLFPQE